MDQSRTWRRARITLGLSQIGLADALGTTLAAIASIEEGRSEPPTPVTASFEQVTGVNLAVLAWALEPPEYCRAEAAALAARLAQRLREFAQANGAAPAGPAAVRAMLAGAALDGAGAWKTPPPESSSRGRGGAVRSDSTL